MTLGDFAKELSAQSARMSARCITNEDNRRVWRVTVVARCGTVRVSEDAQLLIALSEALHQHG